MTLDYALRRIGFFLLVVWIAVTAVFVVMHLAPGDPVTVQLARLQAEGRSLQGGPELIADYRRRFGLDEPLHEQYWHYLVQLAQGNLGYSVASFPTRVSTLIGNALPWTLGLLVTATLISWVVGTLLGAVMAWRSTPALARGLLSSVMLLSAIPYYLLALLLLYVFAYELQWLPAGGGRDPLDASGGLGAVVDTLEHGLLPALSIVLSFVGLWMIGMRSALVGVLGSDHLQLAEAKGLPERQILVRYAMRAAILPQVTSLAVFMGYVVGGAVVVEVLFAYPGIGHVLAAALESRDYPVIEGVVLTMVLATAGALLILDLVYPLIDPRIRYARD